MERLIQYDKDLRQYRYSIDDLSAHEQRMKIIRAHARKHQIYGFDSRLPKNCNIKEEALTLEYFEYMIDQEEKKKR